MKVRIIDLTSRVNDLVNEYGFDAVNAALVFVEAVNRADNGNIRIVDNNTDTYVTISKAVYDEIKAASRAGNKIQAIKTLRAHTDIGLKEAKDIVENTNW